MDSSGLDTANIDLSKLTDRDKQELQAFITNETQVSLVATCFGIWLTDVLSRKQEFNNVSTSYPEST
jgi:hypothetical protein